MMKKFLLVSLLCFAPIFATHAADITVEDCEAWITYDETYSAEDFAKLPALIQDVLKKYEELRTWTSLDKRGFIDIKVADELLSCTDIEDEEEKTQTLILKSITLNLKKALADYKTLETRSRMPFVHDGNVLPGPSRDEDGSFYVEQKFIPKFVNGTLIFLMSLSILMVIVGGLMFLFSSGDSDLTARAKTTIIWAIVGVILTILAYAIVQFIIGIDFSL